MDTPASPPQPAAARLPQPAAARPPKRKALLVGINYVGQPAELAGCVNDVIDMRAVCAALKYDEVCVLFDGRWAGAPDPRDHRVGDARPTLANIVAGFRWLVAGAGPGDRLFLHYSGHGSQLRELVPGSELTGHDGALVPVDYEVAGMIRDDDVRTLLVEPLCRAGASLRIVLDCCHSGTGVDLRYNLSLPAWGGSRAAAAAGPAALGGGGLIARLTAEAVRAELEAWFGAALVEKHMGPGPAAAAAEEEFTEWTSGGAAPAAVSGAAVESRAIAAPALAGPDVIAVSGCSDRQTSADASFGGRAGGALTHYLLEALRKPVADAAAGAAAIWPSATDLLRDLRRRIRAGGYDQVPQFSSETPITAATRYNLL